MLEYSPGQGGRVYRERREGKSPVFEGRAVRSWGADSGVRVGVFGGRAVRNWGADSGSIRWPATSVRSRLLS